MASNKNITARKAHKNKEDINVQLSLSVADIKHLIFAIGCLEGEGFIDVKNRVRISEILRGAVPPGISID